MIWPQLLPPPPSRGGGIRSSDDDVPVLHWTHVDATFNQLLVVVLKDGSGLVCDPFVNLAGRLDGEASIDRLQFGLEALDGEAIAYGGGRSEKAASGIFGRGVPKRTHARACDMVPHGLLPSGKCTGRQEKE